MNSPADFENGAPAGRNSGGPTPPSQRRSNAFGSPGTDTTVKRIDLNDALIRHPDSTFVVRAAGHAMHGAGIDDGDVLLVDRAITASHGHVVIAIVAGELLCRRLSVSGTGSRRVACLVGDMPGTPTLTMTPESPLEVWGVVTTVVKSLAV
jgi:DNA polymerase V